MLNTRSLILSGWFLVISPTYIIGAEHFPVPSGLGGDIFCRIIYAQYMVWYLGIVSVHNVALLALERWFAVTKPTKYKTNFTKRRVYASIVFIWLWSVLLNLPHPMEMGIVTTESGENQCQYFTIITSKSGREAVAFLEFIFKFILPLTLSLAIFFNLRYHARRSKVLSQANQGKTGRRLLRMTMATASVIAVCWLPNQIYYLIFKFGVTQLGTPLHHFTVVLCMFNSTVNPWIYCLTNKNYRRKFAKLLLGPLRKRTDESTHSESQGLSRSARFRATESTGMEMSLSNIDLALSGNDHPTRVAHTGISCLSYKSRQCKLMLPWKRRATITTKEKPAKGRKSDSVTVPQNLALNMSPDPRCEMRDHYENVQERSLKRPGHTM